LNLLACIYLFICILHISLPNHGNVGCECIKRLKPNNHHWRESKKATMHVSVCRVQELLDTFSRWSSCERSSLEEGGRRSMSCHECMWKLLEQGGYCKKGFIHTDTTDHHGRDRKLVLIFFLLIVETSKLTQVKTFFPPSYFLTKLVKPIYNTRHNQFWYKLLPLPIIVS
jgi:hypothetical protein